MEKTILVSKNTHSFNGQGAEPDMSGKDFSEFLSALLAFESGIDPALIKAYEEKYDVKDATTYWKMKRINGVDVPDTDAKGDYISIAMSYREYFTALHVNDIWESVEDGKHTEELIYRMQCAVMNAWNFIGYQLGEAVLIDAGHYIPEQVTWSDGKTYDRYYIWTGEAWTGDEIERLYTIPEGPTIIATRVNMWQGKFTGLDGISSIQDLRETNAMERAMRNVIWRNVDYIEAHLGSVTLADALKKQWTVPSTQAIVKSSMSGIIASAHLAGAQGATDLLVKDGTVSDETGTNILTYMQKFGGANTIVDTPADDTLTGTRIPERITCGVGTDLVKTGKSGNNKIYVDTSTNTLVTIEDFNINVNTNINDQLFFRSTDTGSVTTKDDAAGTLVNVTYSNSKSKSALLKGIKSADVKDIIAKLVLFSADYGFKWAANGALPVINFRYPGDFFVPGEANGIKFENLLIDKTDMNNIRIRVLGADMGSYFGYELTGYTADDIRIDMFRGIGGGFADIYSGFSVNINDFTDGDLSIIPNGWNVRKDTLFLSGWVEKFAEAGYKQVGNNVYYYPKAANDHYIVLLATQWTSDIVASTRQIIYQENDSWENIALVKRLAN